MAVKLMVSGVVQGVGFRPFIYRIAKRYSLKGYVRNLGDAGVEIVISGRSENVEKFIHAMVHEAPPLARVEGIRKEDVKEDGFSEFIIYPSESSGAGGNSVIPPDVAICDDCLRELFDPENPRYMYPFIVCTNCGPRFSIIESLPYDRERTSMRDFPMCEFCEGEYRDPLNRRYHAEPVCCEGCGPKYKLVDSEGNLIDGEPISKAAHLIDSGYIVAIKGIGGFHIACDARSDEVVDELRKRLGREQQPFAVMAGDMETVEKFAYIGDEELEEMVSYRRPIVLLRKKGSYISDLIAPGLHTVGVMLPYAPVHYLLFHHSRSDVYVMTSANYPDMPMVKDNEDIRRIKDAVDFFLIHNRRIVNRVDDSVVRFVNGKRAVIRRSRGFVPLPLDIPYRYEGIAMGAELMNSFSMAHGGRIYPSQYMGNTYRIEVVEYMKEAISSLGRIISMDDPEIVMVDMHPLYNTRKLAREMYPDIPHTEIQHHLAHIAAVMAERNLKDVVGIAVDAVGYGTDGTVWGGEILSLRDGLARREMGINPYVLPGGDLAAIYPIRSLAGILSGVYDVDDVRKIILSRCPDAVASLKYGKRELDVILAQISRGRGIAVSSSLGRILDALSVLLNIAYRRTYEGEPAMKLESFALHGRKDLHYHIPIRREKIMIQELFEQVLESRGDARDIALSAHLAIARAFSEGAMHIADKYGIRDIVLSGGVAYNQIIVGEIERLLVAHGYTLHVSTEVPRGDNGISVGQAYLGGMYLNGELKTGELIAKGGRG